MEFAICDVCGRHYPAKIGECPGHLDEEIEP
jgi:hypothetical protein